MGGVSHRHLLDGESGRSGVHLLAEHDEEEAAPQVHPLLMFAGPAVAMCEAVNSHADPRKYGVRFDMNTLRCGYNSRYCMRFGLNSTGDNDCHLPEGQKWVEMFLGTSITRGYKRRGDAIGQAFGQGGVGEGLKNVGLIVVDPFHSDRFHKAAKHFENCGTGRDLTGCVKGGIVGIDPTGLSSHGLDHMQTRARLLTDRCSSAVGDPSRAHQCGLTFPGQQVCRRDGRNGGEKTIEMGKMWAPKVGRAGLDLSSRWRTSSPETR